MKFSIAGNEIHNAAHLFLVHGVSSASIQLSSPSFIAAMAPAKGGKKKPPAHSDFSKAKSSIKAKQKAAPSNATNTSFKARSIVLPNQGTVTGIEERKQTKLTDEKGRGVEELVTILRGVGSGGSHKADALDSLAVLCGRVPDRVSLGLGLLPIVLPLITSSSAGIRASLQRFMASFLAAVPRDALVPYATTMTLWVTSGMNHIWKEVREDAARLGEVVIDVMGEELARGWQWQRGGDGGATNGQRFYTTLLTALGVSDGDAHASASAHTQSDLSSSPVSKLRLLSCLEKLIRYQSGAGGGEGEGEDDAAATTSPATAFPTWIFQSCLQNPSDWEAFLDAGSHHDGGALAHAARAADIVAPFTATPSRLEAKAGVRVFADVAASAGVGCGDDELAKALGMRFDGGSGHRNDASSSSSSSPPTNPYLQLYTSLHAILLHTLLDHAPSVLGPDAVLTTNRDDSLPLGLRLLDVVIRLTRTLFRAALRGGHSGGGGGVSRTDRDALKNLATLLDRAGAYFPFESRDNRAASQNLTRATTLRRLSAGWCELVGIHRILSGGIASGGGDAAIRSKRKNGGGSSAASTSALHLQSVEAYIVDVLHEASSPSPNVVISSDAATATTTRLSDAEYLALIPTIWYLLTDSEAAAGAGTASTKATAAATPTPTTSSPSSASPLLPAFISHWSSVKNASSPTKTLGFTFLTSICSLPHHPSLRSDIRKLLTRPTSPIYRVLRDDFTIRSVGRYIYEVAVAASRAASSSSSSPPLHRAWTYLLNSTRFDSPLLDADTLLKVLPTLQPFFYVQPGGVATGQPGPAKRVLAADSRLRSIVAAFVAFVEEDYDQGGRDKTVKKFLDAVDGCRVVF